MGDLMLLGDLQSRDVVNVVDGSKLGKINSIDVDTTSGTIIAISVLPNTRFKSFFSKDSTIIIPWNQIVKIGGEVIIVNYNSWL